MIDITGLNKADVLAALYNNSKPQGMGFMHFNPQDMTRTEAEQELAGATQTFGSKTSIYFDYLHGRVMKIDLSGNELDPWLYDRDIGQGAAERVISALKKSAPIQVAT